MIELIPPIIIALAAFALYHFQAKAHREEYVQLIAEHMEERRELLNRIQAPKLAAYQAAGEPSEEPLYVPFDDDKAYDEYVERRAAGEVT